LATPQWLRFAHSIGSLRLYQRKNGPERDGPFMNAAGRGECGIEVVMLCHSSCSCCPSKVRAPITNSPINIRIKPYTV